MVGIRRRKEEGGRGTTLDEIKGSFLQFSTKMRVKHGCGII
jgi:hypothetical protein